MAIDRIEHTVETVAEGESLESLVERLANQQADVARLYFRNALTDLYIRQRRSFADPVELSVNLVLNLGPG